jgi:hypothetical protein
MLMTADKIQLMNHSPSLWVMIAVSFLPLSACLVSRGQRYRHFTTPTPLARKHFLILGFMGGRDPWNADNNLRRLALKLQSMNHPLLHVETLENKKRDLAIRLIRNAFDRNQDGRLDEQESASVRLILYGQSFGGAAVVKLARQLKEMNVPILLTIQIDSVGRADKVIPSNVSRAANLFQRNGRIIRGEPHIIAEEPDKTAIIGNFEFDYRQREIDISMVPWHKRIFREDHNKIEHDPEVWAKVEKLILDAIQSARN